MADFSKCDGAGCPRRDECRRYVVLGSAWQSSFTAPPGCEDECEEFLPAKKEEVSNG
jgi:hypothetical protein